MAQYIIKTGNDYTEFYQNKDTGFKVGYYSVKEMKALYPDGGVRVSGQLKYGKNEAGVISADGIDEVVYKATSGARYKTVGYIELENGSFIAVKKDNLAMLILFFLLGALLLAGLVFGVMQLIQNGGGEDDPTTTKPPLILDVGQEEGEGKLELPEKVEMENKNVTIVGIPEIRFKANQKEQNVILTNHEKNKGICFMEFTIYLDKNGNKKIDLDDELIYKSGLVQPGYSISKFSINRTLEAGEYDAVVMQQPYSLDQQTNKLNNMVVATKIIVTEAEE